MSFELLQMVRELQARLSVIEEQMRALQEKRPPLPPGPKATLTLKKPN
jgi:hypothetical protein